MLQSSPNFVGTGHIFGPKSRSGVVNPFNSKLNAWPPEHCPCLNISKYFVCTKDFKSISILFKMGQPRPIFHLFLVFSNKRRYNFYNKSMWKNVMSIQYKALWFEPTTFRIWASSHNHQTMAPALFQYFLKPYFNNSGQLRETKIIFELNTCQK